MIGFASNSDFEDESNPDLMRDDSKVEAAENEQLIDKGLDKRWRSLVGIMMLGNALIITGAVYVFLSQSEKDSFISGVSYCLLDDCELDGCG